jgi:thioredoxin reductase (NADPH)
VVEQYAGKIHYVEVDIEQDAEIAEAAGVNGTPTLQLFKDKERVANMPGVKQKSQYRQVIDAALEPAKVPA